MLRCVGWGVLNILPGIEDLKADTDQWGPVSGADSIIGAVNTYKKNGQKNKLDPEGTMIDYDDVTAEQSFHADRLDIRRAGFIRIPVCGPEEIAKNISTGKDSIKNWRECPCNQG